MKTKLILTLLILTSFTGLTALAKHLYKEAEYQTLYCNKVRGVLEYELDDKCRVDCLTETHAIEFDFAPKWAESIGQSLYYSMKTGKKAGVVLILENGKYDEKYLKRLHTVTDKLNIDVWTMTPEDMPAKDECNNDTGNKIK